MKKNWYLCQLVAITTLILVACNSASDAAQETSSPPAANTTQQTPTDTVGAEATASTALDYAGIYKGLLPCADCEGIETTLQINADKTYQLTTQYLGKKEAAEKKSEGSWSWVTGNIMKLEAEQNGPNQYFISEGKVFQLDLAGNRITGKLADNYSLVKVP